MNRAAMVVFALGAAVLLSPGCPTVDGIDLTIEDNPLSTISPLARWTTEHAGSSSVEFCDADQRCFRVEGAGDGETTVHEIAVVGMRADTTYTVEAVTGATTGVEYRSDPQEWTTGPLPYDWMIGEVDVADPAASDDWILTNVATGVFGPIVVVMLDRDGQPVWYREYGDDQGRADIEAALIDGERVLIGPGVAGGMPLVEVDLAGNVVWEGPVQPEIGDDGATIEDALGDGVMHHTLRRLPGGDTMTTEFLGIDGVIGDVLTRFDAGGNELWSWNAFDHLEVDPDDVGAIGEWTHVNTVIVDDLEGVVWANSWHLDRFWQIDQDTGEILLTVGAGGDLQPDPDAEFPWFEGAHGLQPVGWDHWLLYDNGASGRGFSRLLELELDLEQMTSRIVWEYPGELADDPWYNYAWGDVELLDDGHLLMIAGNAVEGYDPTRIVELTRDGEILWQLWCHLDGDVTTGAFAATAIEPRAIPIDGGS